MAFNLQSALVSITARITPEQLADDERFQREMREKLGSRANPDSPEERLLRTMQQESEVIKQIEFLRVQPKTVLRDQRLSQSLNRYAELLSQRGLYREAAGISPDEPRRGYYAQIADAIEDPTLCDCADDIELNPKNRNEIIMPALHKIEDIFIGGETRELYKCRKCDCYQINAES